MTEKILVHHLARNVNEVYPYFADMARFVSIHPVIYKHETISENEYRLYERLAVAGMGVSFSYPVTIESTVPSKQVVLFSEIRKGVKLKLVFDFIENGSNTKIVETVLFTAPFPVSYLFLPFLAKTHAQMMNNILAAN